MSVICSKIMGAKTVIAFAILEDKFLKYRFDSDEKLSQIVSYFPLSENETQEILSILESDRSFNGFRINFYR